jgi:hypothetical protein
MKILHACCDLLAVLATSAILKFSMQRIFTAHHPRWYDRRTLARAATLSLGILLTFPACSTLVGSVRPVEDKTDQYSFLDLSKKQAEWTRVSPVDSNQDQDLPETVSVTQHSDLIFQHLNSDAVISVNSACRSSERPDSRSLQDLTKTLFLGFSQVESRSEKVVTVSSQEALETTLLGQLGGERTQMKSTVFRSRYCVFDLLYVARPERFNAYLSTFDQFVSEFRLHP